MEVGAPGSPAEFPAVSVLLPVYNSAATLAEALDSLRQQTLSNYELVAVDDGSDDATPDILKDWASKDTRIHVFTQPHGGIIQALNYGLKQCRAPYVARMDADDRCHPLRLQKQVEFLLTHSEIALAGCLVKGFPEGQVRQGYQIYIDWQNSLVTDADIRREMFVESPLAHPSVIFRKDIVQALGGYQEQGWPEDYDLWLRLYLAGEHFGKVPQALLEWREYPERLTRTDSRYSLENFIRAKAFYLAKGPLAGRDAVMIWGAGMIGRRLSKHLLRLNCPLAAFIDIDPRKIGRLRRGCPILPPDEMPAWRGRYANPLVLAAVGSRGARAIIRSRLEQIGLHEGKDWLGVA